MILLQEGNKNRTRLGQKNVPKTYVEQIKDMGNYISIYIHWAPSSKHNPCSPMCSNAWPMSTHV